MKPLILSLAFAWSALAQSGPPFIVSAPLFDASTSTATKPFSVKLNTGALQVSGCTPGMYAFVISNGLTYSNNATGSCTWVPLIAGAGGTNGQIQWNNSGLLSGFTASGDATITTSTGVVNVSKLLGGTLTGIVMANGSSNVSAATGAQIATSFTGCSSGNPILLWTGACGSASGSSWYYTNTSGSTTCGSYNCKAIAASVHGQGTTPFVFCTSLAPTSGHYADSSNQVLCPAWQTPLGAPGDVTVAWTGTDAQGIVISGAGGGGGGGGGGTVTNFTSQSSVSPFFTTSVATSTSTPALSFTVSNAAQNSVLAGPATGGAGAPTYQTAPTISAANMTSFPTLNQNTTGTAANLSGTPALPNGTTATTQTTGDNSTKIATDAFVLANVGSGTVVTSGTMYNNAIVTSAGGNTIQTQSGQTTLDSMGDIATEGFLSSSKGLNVVQGSYPGTYAVNSFTFWAPTSIPTAYGWMIPSADAAGLLASDGAGTPGHLSSAPLSGDATTSGHVLTLATVNSAPGLCGDATHVCQVTTNGKGLVTAQTQVAISGGGSGVTSVGLSLPPFITVSGSPVTSSGTLTGTLANQAANAMLIGPTSGSPAPPTFRSLVSADVAAAGTLSNSTTGTATTATNLASYPTLCSGQYSAGLSSGNNNCTNFPTFNQNTTGTAANLSGTPALPNGVTATTQSVGDSTTKLATDAFVLANVASGVNPLLPATSGAGTVAVSTTSVTGTGTNFTSLFPLCTPTCSHGEAIAIYPATITPSTPSYFTTSPVPTRLTTTTPIESGSLVWGVDGTTFSLNPGDQIIPTRAYSTIPSNSQTPTEFWSIFGTFSTGTSGNKLRTGIPVYPGVGSRFPYPWIYASCDNPPTCSAPTNIYLVTNGPIGVSTTSGSSTVVIGGAGGLNGTYTISDNTFGSNYAAESAILQLTNTGVTPGDYIIEGMTATISSTPVGNQATVSIAVSAGTATATFLYPHGFTVGDAIHISGCTSWTGSASATVATVGNNDWPNVLTFSTGASNGTYNNQTCSISIASYTVVPKPVWSTVSSVTSATSLTISTSATVAAGATWYAAPDNVATFQTLTSGTSDVTIPAGRYYFNNDPLNTGTGILSTNFSNQFGMTGGAQFILTNPQYQGFVFNGGKGMVLDGWTVNSLYQINSQACNAGIPHACTTNVPFPQTIAVTGANRPTFKNISSQMSVGNFLDVEASVQPRYSGFRTSNIAGGGCFAFANNSYSVISDGFCSNTTDQTFIANQNNWGAQTLRGAVLSNISQVNTSASLVALGPDIVATNFYIEGCGEHCVQIEEGQGTIGTVKLSHFQINNGTSQGPVAQLQWSAYNADVYVQGSPGVGITLEDISSRSPYASGFLIRGGGVTIRDCNIDSPAFEGISASGTQNYMTISNTHINNPGGMGLLLFGASTLKVNDVWLTNTNGTFNYPGLTGFTVLTDFNTSESVDRLHIIDTRGTALGYAGQISATATFSRWSDNDSNISDVTHPFYLAGGIAGDAFVRNSPYGSSGFPGLATTSNTISPIADINVLTTASTAINHITVPAAMQKGDQLCLLTNQSGVTLGTSSGNIASASTMLVGKRNCLSWDGTSFWPSY